MNRFFEKVKYSDSCWDWLGSLNQKGYGQFYSNKKVFKAHRWSYIYFVGQIKESKHILHHCDNRKCVNPFHLYEGDHLTNMKDMCERKRHRNQIKTHCPKGHEYTKENTYMNPKGQRYCIECRKSHLKKWYEAKQKEKI